jgi:hypothetical protein
MYEAASPPLVLGHVLALGELKNRLNNFLSVLATISSFQQLKTDVKVRPTLAYIVLFLR